LARSFSCARNPRHMVSRTPVSSQSLSRRQHVLALPYRDGRALHGAPVQRIQRIPSKHCRSSTRGRPPWGRAFGRGSCSRIFAHCLSVTLCHAMTTTPHHLHSHRHRLILSRVQKHQGVLK
jgi:hypothetical protein